MNRTEHAPDNAHCGEKSDDFGSRTELPQRKANELEYSAQCHGRGVSVVQVPSEASAAQRARWLSELSDALEEARRVIGQLSAADGQINAAELNARIDAIRLEVQALRLRRNPQPERDSDPEWTKDFPWKRSA
jgi:hypothetical protein